MNVLVEIGGREAIPVRAIPFVSSWAFDPYQLARELARVDQRLHLEVGVTDDSGEWIRAWGLVAYKRPTESNDLIEVKPIEWVAFVTKLDALSSQLQATAANADLARSQWMHECVKVLPSGVFVWKDEFQTAWRNVMQYVAPSIGGDSDLVFSPLMSTEEVDVVLEGFEVNEDLPESRQSYLRAARMSQMLSEQATPEYQRDASDVQAAFKRLDVAKATLDMMREALANAPKTGDVEKIRNAQAAVDEAQQEVEQAQAAFECLRGDDDSTHAVREQRAVQETSKSHGENGGATTSPSWKVIKPQRYIGYRAPLYRLIATAHREGRPCPTARDVVEAFTIEKPPEIAMVLPNGIDYYDAKGETKAANLEAIRKAINRMTKGR